MRAFSSTDATLTAEYGIEVGRWEQYPALDSLPFNVMWCVIPGAQQSVLDQHPEHELAVVVSGHATFHGDTAELDAPAGTAVLLQPGERHVIRNLRAEVPVRIMSVYWLAEAEAEAAAEADTAADTGTEAAEGVR